MCLDKNIVSFQEVLCFAEKNTSTRYISWHREWFLHSGGEITQECQHHILQMWRLSMPCHNQGGILKPQNKPHQQCSQLEWVTHGRWCLCVINVTSCWGWAYWDGAAEGRKETRSTDGWPKLKGDSNYLRKYLPRRLFLRMMLRIVKYIWCQKEKPRRKQCS